MKYVVIGGGIAGTCCTEELCRVVGPNDNVVLISAAPVLKVAFPCYNGNSVGSLRYNFAHWLILNLHNFHKVVSIG